jgi:hypothetical protein
VIALSLFLALAACAQGVWAAESCAALINRCSKMTDQQLLDAALLQKQYEGPTHLGTCYAEDRTVCPTCQYDNYVRLAYLPWDRGYDGGTGAIEPPDPEGKTQTAERLRQLCLSGQCCCPNNTYKPCSQGGPVKMQDLITFACCTFPNPCSVPDVGWALWVPDGVSTPCS